MVPVGAGSGREGLTVVTFEGIAVGTGIGSLVVVARLVVGFRSQSWMGLVDI